MVAPYFDQGGMTIYHGDAREILPALGLTVDAVIADPPYGETTLAWDCWPAGWVDVVTEHVRTNNLWCFGSMRMFLERSGEFAAWRFAQDVVWEKQNGSGFATDRFKRVHEHVTHWYRGKWTDLNTTVPQVKGDGVGRWGLIRRGEQTPHMGRIGPSIVQQDHMRLTRSVIKVNSEHKYAQHPTQKPLSIITPLIAYSVPEGGTVLDPFMGSGSTLVAAREHGRTAIGIEVSEKYCEVAARRLEQGIFSFGIS